VDAGSVTGKNTYTVDLDDENIDAEEGDQYEVRIAQGTVDGKSVVGEIVGHFYVAAAGLTDAQKADVNAEVDTAVAGLATAAALATVDNNVDAILVDTGTTLPASLSTIDNNVDAILVDTGTTIPATLTTIDNFLDTEIAAILEDTST